MLKCRSNIYRNNIPPLSRIHSFPCGSAAENPFANTEDMGLIPVLGRSPGEEKGNALQYSCLRNPMDKRAWWAIVHGVTSSQTRLSDCFSFNFHLVQAAAILNFISFVAESSLT